MDGIELDMADVDSDLVAYMFSILLVPDPQRPSTMNPYAVSMIRDKQLRSFYMSTGGMFQWMVFDAQCRLGINPHVGTGETTYIHCDCA